MSVKNFTQYFSAERDVFVTNLSNCQVSVTFEVGPGHSESFLFTNSKDPVNLTRFVPFNAIKGSMDLRKMLNRVPPALKLIDEDEFNAYYERQVAVTGLSSVEEAMDKAEQRRSTAQNHTPLSDAIAEEQAKDEDGKKTTPKQVVSEVEEINARVLHLCLQVHPSVPDQSKMSAQQLLSELDSLTGLTLDDWNYVLSHSYYKSVRNQAKKMIASLVGPDEATTPTKNVAKSAKKSKSVEV